MCFIKYKHCEVFIICLLLIHVNFNVINTLQALQVFYKELEGQLAS